MTTKAFSFPRVVEICAAVLVAAAMVSMQVFIGGTRPAFSLPIYALLGLAGLLAIFSLRRAKPLPGRLCLWSAAFFFGYLLVRAWFSPVSYLARSDVFPVLGGLVVYLSFALAFTSATWRMAIEWPGTAGRERR